jgi:nicotinamide mononucleotide (NMN) deamidase PncC
MNVRRHLLIFLSQELEGLLTSHTDEAKTNIAAVTQSLLNDHVMVSTVTANLEVFNARQKKVMDEVITAILCI